jgi:hypothetical protein
MEKVSWTDRVRDEEILRKAKWRGISCLQGKECNQKDWPHLKQERLSKTRYLRKD